MDLIRSAVNPGHPLFLSRSFRSLTMRNYNRHVRLDLNNHYYGITGYESIRIMWDSSPRSSWSRCVKQTTINVFITCECKVALVYAGEALWTYYSTFVHYIRYAIPRIPRILDEKKKKKRTWALCKSFNADRVLCVRYFVKACHNWKLLIKFLHVLNEMVWE